MENNLRIRRGVEKKGNGDNSVENSSKNVEIFSRTLNIKVCHAFIFLLLRVFLLYKHCG